MTTLLIVRSGHGARVDERLVEGGHLEPGAVSRVSHVSTHLQLCQSVENKQEVMIKKRFKTKPNYKARKTNINSGKHVVFPLVYGGPDQS